MSLAGAYLILTDHNLLGLNAEPAHLFESLIHQVIGVAISPGTVQPVDTMLRFGVIGRHFRNSLQERCRG